MKKLLFLSIIFFSSPCFAQDNLLNSFWKEKNPNQERSNKAMGLMYSSKIECVPRESSKSFEAFDCKNEFRVSCLKIVNKKTKASEIYCSFI